MYRKAVIRELSAPIKNPKPDGRKRNWTGEKEFPAGRYADDGVSIRRVKGCRYDYLQNGYRPGEKEQVETFVKHSTIVEPKGIHELLLVLGERDAEKILGVLLHNGTITRDMIEGAASELNESEDLWERV